MNLAEVGQVLAKASAGDGRKVSHAQALLWLEVLADYDVADCLAAVTEHFATSDAYLMPVHIRRIADREAARRRSIATHNRAIEAADAIDSLTMQRDRSAELDDLVRALRVKLPDTSAAEVFRRPEWVAAEAERERAARPAEPNPAYTGTAAAPAERMCGTFGGGLYVHSDHTYVVDGTAWWCRGITQAEAENADMIDGRTP